MSIFLHVEKRYINIPVADRADKIAVTLRNAETGKLFSYFDVPVETSNPDYMAFYDMKRVLGQTLKVETADAAQGEAFRDALLQSDEPLIANVPADCPRRPQYHFSSRCGWINDPNGLFFYGGIYHLFYQHNPFFKTWGNMHWGHAVSSDLLNWREQGDVLYPDDHGSMFSGSAVVDWNNTSGLGRGSHPPILLFYTAAGTYAPKPCEYTQCLAYSVDGGNTFVKYENNPIVGNLAPENRDPKVIWHEESRQWIMALYLGDRDHTFCLLVSENLLDWKVIQKLTISGGRECPDFFPLPVVGENDLRKWVLIEANGKYLIGDFDGTRFVTEEGPHQSFENGGSEGCYAGQTWSDIPLERRIFVGWQQGTCQAPEFDQTMTIPVEFSLRRFTDGLRLCALPIREVAAQHGASWRFRDIEPLNCIPEELGQIPPGHAWDIELEMNCDCRLFVTVCGEVIALDAIDREVRIGGVKLKFAEEEALGVRILVDRTSIEVFTGLGRTWCAKRVLTACTPPVIFSGHNYGSGSLASMTIYAMKTIER